nr:hypothetical protein [Streptomyces sp. SID4948]
MPPAYPPPLPPPPAPPRPPDVPRAVAVALLNLSGLGLGYALLRRWPGMAACWLATGLLLFVALPAEPDGVPGGAVLGYLLFLAVAAVHGGIRGLRTPLAWPPRSAVAVVLGLVLLAAPAGGAVLYNGARDQATQRMLLDRLARADHLVVTARSKPFSAAQGEYRSALAAYRELRDDHPDSRAARAVPARLRTYYAAVAAPYAQGKFCAATAPLRYLRTLPASFGTKDLGALAGWPDDRLATSLYACGSADLHDAGSAGPAAADDLGELLATFPKSPQAARVEPAVRSTIAEAAGALKGKDPCAATDRLRTLGRRASGLGARDTVAAGGLKADVRTADGYVRTGTYACGVHQYRSGDFGRALDTMNGFVKAYPHDRNGPLAGKIATAAEIARHEPAAGQHLPTTASGGGISVTVSNDSPDEVEVLYTGPVTGRFTLKGCGACSTYSSQSQASRTACGDSGKHYPRKTLSLPPGTTYFLHKPSSSSGDTPGEDTATLQYGYVYTECAYTVESGFGL